MNALEAKILFELNKDGKVTIEVRGSKMAAKSGLLTIIERMAELDGSTTSELLTELSEVAKLSQNHQEMPEELKNIPDKMFGGSK